MVNSLKIIDLLLQSVIIMSIHLFFSKIGNVSNQRKMAFTYIAYIICYFLIYLSEFSSTLLVILNFILIFFISNLYQSTLKWKLVSSLFLLTLLILSGFITPSIATNSSTSFYIISLALSLAFPRFILLFFIIIFIRIKKEYGHGYLNKNYWILLFSFPFLSILSIIASLHSSFIVKNSFLLPILSIFLLIINVLVFLLCDYFLIAQEEKKQKHSMEQQSIYYLNQYYLMKKIQEENHKIQHDVKNIVIGITNSSPHHSQLKTDFNSWMNSIKKTQIFVSGNPTIDSILNYKFQDTELKDIKMEVKLNLPSNLNLNTIFICSLLGNLLDNAIEACQQIENEADKYITVTMNYLNESLYLNITNPYVHEIKKKRNGNFLSSKDSAENHGIGLLNITNEIRKSGGIISINFDNNVFEVDVVLFDIKKVEC